MQLKFDLQFAQEVEVFEQAPFLYTWLFLSALDITAAPAMPTEPTLSLASSSSSVLHVHVSACCADTPQPPLCKAVLHARHLCDCQAPALLHQQFSTAKYWAWPPSFVSSQSPGHLCSFSCYVNGVKKYHVRPWAGIAAMLLFSPSWGPGCCTLPSCASMECSPDVGAQPSCSCISVCF